LLLGIWSVSGILGVPFIVILNSRGGVDMTAQLSDGSVDPLRHLPLDRRQSEKDLKIAQWFYLIFLICVAIGCYFYFSSL
jgi:hypothetical protein